LSQEDYGKVTPSPKGVPGAGGGCREADRYRTVTSLPFLSEPADTVDPRPVHRVKKMAKQLRALPLTLPPIGLETRGLFNDRFRPRFG
jgi:hypothetical protein